MTTKTFGELIELALAIERGQQRRVGRPLHPSERWWIVRAGFKVKYGETLGERLATKVIAVINEAERAMI